MIPFIIQLPAILWFLKQIGTCGWSEHTEWNNDMYRAKSETKKENENIKKQIEIHAPHTIQIRGNRRFAPKTHTHTHIYPV